jgi:hypothetical protein
MQVCKERPRHCENPLHVISWYEAALNCKFQMSNKLHARYPSASISLLLPLLTRDGVWYFQITSCDQVIWKAPEHTRLCPPSNRAQKDFKMMAYYQENHISHYLGYRITLCAREVG